MNRLPLERRAQIIGLLAGGNSLRAVSRLADVSINTVTKLLLDVGTACGAHQDETIRGLKIKRMQCDEIWSFVHTQAKNLPEQYPNTFGHGDVWTWTALDPDTKLIVSWAVGRRDAFTALAFIRNLADRLTRRVQLTMNGVQVYLGGVEGALDSAIDDTALAKIYEGYGSKSAPAERRYSPAVRTGALEQTITGNADPSHISTSFLVSKDFTTGTSTRHFARLTDVFSKKVNNHKAAIALHFMHHNFARIHRTLQATPAMEAGLADHVWGLDEIVRLSN